MPNFEDESYQRALENTDPDHIFTPYNNKNIEENLNRPYLIYNSCGPIDETDEKSHTVAFPEKNKDCLYIGELVLRDPETSLAEITPPVSLQQVKKAWDESKREDITIEPTLIKSPMGQQYVLFTIMADYPKVIKLVPEKMTSVKLYKDALKKNKKVYDSIPSFENEAKNPKVVSLHVISLESISTIKRLNQKGEKYLSFYDKKEPFFLSKLNNFSCRTMDGGCNPQKRFLVQLASIINHEKSDLILEKKGAGHSHFAIRDEESGESVAVDGYPGEDDAFYHSSIWSDQGYYRFLKFLGAPIFEGNGIDSEEVSVSMGIRIESKGLKKTRFQISSFNEEKGAYQALFQFAPDPHYGLKNNPDLFTRGFRTGLMMTLPFDRLLLEMAKFTHYNVQHEIKKTLSVSFELSVFQKMQKEMGGEESNYDPEELVIWKKMCIPFLEDPEKLPNQLTDDEKENIQLYVEGGIEKINLENQEALKNMEVFQVKEKQLEKIIHQLQMKMKKTDLISVQQQFLQSVKSEAKRQLLFLKTHFDSIINDAAKDYKTLQNIKEKVSENLEILPDELIVLKEQFGLNPADKYFKNHLLDCMQELSVKKEILEAKMRYLGDVIAYQNSAMNIPGALFYPQSGMAETQEKGQAPQPS